MDRPLTGRPGRPCDRGASPAGPLDQNPDPAIKYFSGIATYTRDFIAPRGWAPGRPLWLDLGDVHEIARVTVNGQPAGSAWHAPFRLDIGATARKGRNHLTIDVANLWVNRLIGDAQSGAHKITWTSMPSYLASASLHPSGLIGPVTLSKDSR